jgi:hypothetical protein
MNFPMLFADSSVALDTQVTDNIMLRIRLTSLGEFSHIGRLFDLGSF